MKFAALHLFALAIVFVSITSCSKDDPASAQECYLARQSSTNESGSSKEQLNNIYAGSKIISRYDPLANDSIQFEYDTQGRLVKLKKRGSVTTSARSWVLTHEGSHIVKQEFYSGTMLTLTEIYEYDANDRLVKILRTQFDGKPVDFDVFKYSDNTNNISTFERYSHDQTTPYNVVTYTYGDGKSPAALVTPEVFKYDQLNGSAMGNNRLTVTRNSFLYSTSTFEFNDKGLPTKETRSGSAIETMTWSYSYTCD